MGKMPEAQNFLIPPRTFECIFKLIVALTFLMCVVCSHYQYSFLMFYIILLFSFYVCLFVCLFYDYFLERKTEKREVKLKKIKKVESRIKIFYMETFLVQLFFPPD